MHYSTWEPRPTNFQENHTMPAVGAMAAAFATRPRGSEYDSRWDSWLLPRVSGRFTGTTDEIFQWAACKWGLSDNLLRGMAVRESTWFQVLHFTDGQCYWNRGCGDAFSGPNADTVTYCNGLATSGGHDYQTDTNSASAGKYPYTPAAGMCPKTFSILGIMSWENPAWVAPAPAYAQNQNGTFPFTRDSTAAAADYLAGYIRGCYNGWIHWLGPAGDMNGCVGAWYAGNWHSADGDAYAGRVQTEITNLTWLQPSFATGQYSCDSVKGCPV